MRAGIGRRAATVASPARSGGPHRVETAKRLDGPDEQRGGPSGRLGDDVQAVVHPVDKVHVGRAREPVHHGVPGGPAEPGVGGPVVLADVRLDLDDPGDPDAGGVLADEPGAEELAAGVEGRPGQDRPQVGQGAGACPAAGRELRTVSRPTARSGRRDVQRLEVLPGSAGRRPG